MAIARKTIICFLILMAATLAACGRVRRVDMGELEKAGMSYTRIEELRKMDVTESEVAEVVKVRQSGVSDATCVEVVRIFRGRAAEPAKIFSAGDRSAGLRRAGMREAAILELARLDQLGIWAGEARAIRLAGISDEVILELARRRAAGQPTLSGPTLTQLRNAGMDNPALLELVRDGITDEAAEKFLSARRRATSCTTFRRR